MSSLMVINQAKKKMAQYVCKELIHGCYFFFNKLKSSETFSVIHRLIVFLV